MKSNSSAWCPFPGSERRTLVGLALALQVLLCPALFATATVTEPTGGQNISADKAVDSTSGATNTLLGSIVITEGAITDFAPGASQTLILTAPDGWRFTAGVGSVGFTGSRDITAASIGVTTSNVTVTLSVGGTG